VASGLETKGYVCLRWVGNERWITRAGMCNIQNVSGLRFFLALFQIQKVQNRKLWERYAHRRQEVGDENGGQANERMLFHGSSFINAIVQKGFDERYAYIGGMFGAGKK